MNLKILRLGGLLVITAGLALTACVSRDAAGPDESETVETTTSPATEETGPETPLTEDGEVSVSLPGLPVGGGADDDSQVRQCVTVSWLGDEDVPGGVAVVVSGVSVDPSGVFEVDGSSCGGLRGCVESFAFTAADEQCSVPVRALGTDGDEAQLRLSGSARCADKRRCEEFAATVSGDSIGLTQPFEDPEPTTDESPTDEPTTEEPTDEPTQTS